MLKFGVRAKLRGLGLYPQIPAQQGLVPFLSRLAWMLWSIGCNRGAIARTGVAPSPLAPQWAARFQSEIDNAPLTTIAAEDHAPGYYNEPRPQELRQLNRVNEYRTVTPSLLKALREFLDAHRAEIDRLIGHPWRVSSVRQFYLRPFDRQGARHTDGWPLAIRKIFILPKGATAQTGTTWFELRDGRELVLDEPQPLWLIFENSRVRHALTPGQVPRPTIELNIVPARRTSTEPNNAGINGWYPWFPWR
jgi:hypothetical protein